MSTTVLTNSFSKFTVARRTVLVQVELKWAIKKIRNAQPPPITPGEVKEAHRGNCTTGGNYNPVDNLIWRNVVPSHGEKTKSTTMGNT